jgi:hypothetical protein
MEAAFEVIQLVVHSGFQALRLALVYASWRDPAGQPRVTTERDEVKIIALGLRCPLHTVRSGTL